MHVVVCGGGVIGAATAFYLTELGAEVTLVERCELAAAASGKAGGFLARDWCDGNAMGPLARASFDLHAELAERLDADYGYRRVDTLMVAGADEGSVSAYARLPASSWLDGNCAVNGRIGTPGDHCAGRAGGVHPRPRRRRPPERRGAGPDRHGGRAPRRKRPRRGGGRGGGGRRPARGRRGRARHGTLDRARRAMDPAPAHRGPQGMQHHPAAGLRGPGRDAVLRIPHRGRRDPFARNLPAARRRGVGLRDVGRPTGPDRSRERPRRRRALRRAPAHRGDARVGARQRGDHAPASLLPSNLRRRDAASRTGARRTPRRLRRHRPQLLGDPERPGERQGDGGTRRPRRGALRRPRPLQPLPASSRRRSDAMLPHVPPRGGRNPSGRSPLPPAISTLPPPAGVGPASIGSGFDTQRVQLRRFDTEEGRGR